MSSSNLSAAIHLDASSHEVIHFVQITDTHLFIQPEQNFAFLNPEETFLAVLDDIAQNTAHALDFLIHTGDLAQEAVETTYQRYLGHINQLAYPNFRVPGNHDDQALFPFHHDAKTPTIIHIGPWSIILLNTPVTGKIYGQLSAEQLNQLDQLLAAHPEQHIILACHHHPFELASAWLDQHILKNTPDLLAILKKYNHIRACIYGHVHQASDQIWHGIRFISCPSTCLQFKPQHDEFALDHLAPGYRLFELYPNGELNSTVKRIALTIDQVDLNFAGY